MIELIDNWLRKRRIRKIVKKLNGVDPGSDYDEQGIPYWDKWHRKEK